MRNAPPNAEPQSKRHLVKNTKCPLICCAFIIPCLQSFVNLGFGLHLMAACSRTGIRLPSLRFQRFLGKCQRAIMTVIIQRKDAPGDSSPGGGNMTHSISSGSSGDYTQNRPGQQTAQDPEFCPCKRKKCPRYRNCDACRAHHAAKGRPPYCERRHRRPGK